MSYWSSSLDEAMDLSYDPVWYDRVSHMVLLTQKLSFLQLSLLNGERGS